jgi:uncharacterized membrane protein YgcG
VKHRLAAAFGVVIAVLFLAAAPLAHADVNDFTITSFTADDTLSTSDAQGELHIVERINVDFRDFNHGILRAIPNSYKNHRLQLHINKVSSDSGAPAMYSTYGQNGNTVLKIGDANRTITGTQEYTVDYTVHNVMTFYQEHDELYWDVNGDQWDQPSDRVQVTLHLPESIKQSRAPICYAGSFGDTSQLSCNTKTSGHTITASTTRPLAAQQTLSLVAGFDKGVFHPAKWYETLGEYAPFIIAFLVPFLVLVVPTGIMWYRRGRDPKGTGVIVPEYGPPKDLGPIEVGTLIDFRTDNKDLTATIIDLAVRRYITIVEQTKNRMLRSDLTTYTLRLEKTDFTGLTQFEIKILAGLFSGAEAGSEVDIAALKFKLSETATSLRRLVMKDLKDRGYINDRSITMRQIGWGVGLFFALWIGYGVCASKGVGAPYGIGAVLGAAIAAAFVYFMSSRTEKGVAAKEQIEGLKMYLEVAEKDRIQKLQSPNAAYAPKSGEPKRTVGLFEKLLPYAMILGVEQQWAKQFESIYRTPPDWYSGNWNTFSILYFTSTLSSGLGAQVNSAFSAPSSSSGSGFGGGGAGGGGGGGGGGGW